VGKKDIGQLIKKRRKFLKLTQIDLSDIIGMSRRSLQMIEKGEGNPTFEQLSKILSTLGLEIKISVKRVNDV
jgi:y4mF family transcriptional regulator